MAFATGCTVKVDPFQKFALSVGTVEKWQKPVTEFLRVSSLNTYFTNKYGNYPLSALAFFGIVTDLCNFRMHSE